MSWPRESAVADSAAASAEERDAGDERAAAAEAVAERAGGEQERGERQRVGVDDPLLLRLAGVEVGGDAGERVGEHRHAGDDHHQREAHHREDPTPVGVLDRRGAPGARAVGESTVTGAPGGRTAGDAVGRRSGLHSTETDAASG